ncbi:glycosyl hydrolase 2 galactose-binding domain-containing protein [Flexivirga oryzae]|uniref:beta-mannosidase n=1 Tax=Flexivirga oryzae TaxID=1794944 RepID=A0A839MXP2_9MICO|nr:glycoside hydrolase family 2 protein [Flexivirga oryzae]MBB2890158.1 beta-mannosidase [Flexivirga oryzae]
MNAAPDLLAEVSWECARAGAGSTQAPELGWVIAPVPGTAAQALRDIGDPGALNRTYDADDWWWHCEFTVESAGQHALSIGGVATFYEVLVDDDVVLDECNMFIAHNLDLHLTKGRHTLLVHCRSLQPLLARRRPRPRWKSPDLVHQNLRWVRTSLLGRQIGGVQSPAPVGPWRPITLRHCGHPQLRSSRLRTECADDGSGTVQVVVELLGIDRSADVTVQVGDAEAPLDVAGHQGTVTATGSITLPRVERWWPHTHGTQPLYDVIVTAGSAEFHIGRVGFRTVAVDRSDGAFTLRVNDIPIFARGACWSPTDPVSLCDGDLRRHLETVRDGNHNVIRVSGTGVYPSAGFLDLCDELGLLIWQDCMFAFFDAPDEDDFNATLAEEVRQLLESFGGRPSLAVVCGSSDAEEQAAYLGLPPEKWVAPVAATLIPRLVAEHAPGTPYVSSSPSGSPLPSMVNAGPSHYYGVGAYLQPTTDARRAGVRFASECLCMACPAEPMDSIEGVVAQRRLGHHPAWKALIHRDAQSSWDLEDIREWYTRHLFGLDPIELRRADGSHAAAVARATVATVFEDVLSEWRRPDSSCAGSIVFEGHDVGFGGGIGIVDGHGRPKAPWYVMRRLMEPVAVMLTNEGVNGLAIHIANDGPRSWEGQLRVDLVSDGGHIGESLTLPVQAPVPGTTVDLMTALGEFRDISYIHRFGPPAYDVVAVTLVAPDGSEVSQASFLAGPRLRPVDAHLGLDATARQEEGDCWLLDVSTDRFAQWVHVNVDGWQPDDSWFHLLPGATRTVRLQPRPDVLPGPPRGEVMALNAARSTRIAVAP